MPDQLSLLAALLKLKMAASAITQPETPLAQPATPTPKPKTPLEALSSLYSDQDNRSERLVFVTPDGQYVPFSSNDSSGVSLKLSDIVRGLAQKGATLQTVTDVYHNHNDNKDFSPEDNLLYEVLKKYGLTGGFHIYYPRTGRIKTKKEKLP